VGKVLTRKIEQEEKRGGPAIIRKKRRDRNLDSYRVRYSKYGLMSRFKVDYEIIPQI
jgi:mRNA-degrading endonuclease RelE of RelBE toxin-antitoxin system